ncbi:beta-lactamase/transpeptidase-like protein [Ilyonectria robusta]|uniref:beta-lactamase/transpeptidase-like protein n=1 Tax=Ilyonectria robusta TaxID=1079257 RepID=UPI001E8D32A0|nr:beta-lactamase/transpeptidase-like protein [Ilyonectria robusta]KAH8685127.1 beta-lactamase/transpeptidase-like protein [Ilyonectria robusta]
MRSSLSSLVAILLFGALPVSVSTQDTDNVTFSACPLIGAYYPPPTISKSSGAFSQLASTFTDVFDELVKDGGSEKYGSIMPNTTSFSVVLFGGSHSLREDPIFFEYHYTSPADQSVTGASLTSSTKFPVGDVTMVFTVYAWLVDKGEQWEESITKYLPELARIEGPLTVPWEDVTIGSLAGQMSGLSRQSFASDFAEKSPIFLPDTTPMVSYAAFQLLAFAMQRENGHKRGNHSWASVLEKTLLRSLNMTSTSLLCDNMTDVFAIDGLNISQIGEPGALSLVSSIEDLARAGHSMLSSTLLAPAITRRWLHANADTSNLRNGVGRPWEVYRAGSSAISPVLDVLTKSGTIGQYASYFGLAPDFGAGFAILAHDSTVQDRKLDLNVYADIVSESLGYMQVFAAKELALRYAGRYEGEDHAVAVLNLTDDGPGLEVQSLILGEVDLKAEVAKKLDVKLANLDFRIYPTNVQDTSKHQFVAVFQDKSAPIDMGTPTCITWQEVGATTGIKYSLVFLLDTGGNAVGLELLNAQTVFKRME